VVGSNFSKPEYACRDAQQSTKQSYDSFLVDITNFVNCLRQVFVASQKVGGTSQWVASQQGRSCIKIRQPFEKLHVFLKR
jgi:hypothetical protein